MVFLAPDPATRAPRVEDFGGDATAQIQLPDDGWASYPTSVVKTERMATQSAMMINNSKDPIPKKGLHFARSHDSSLR
jgi:hypothetical protein